MTTIELKNIAHAYTPGQYAVENINLTWTSGVSSALLGPSGCGKTTLLKIISGLLKPSEGQVLLDGEVVNDKSPKERNIAQVFQFPVVYETLNVFDNLAFPLRNRKIPENQVRNRVHGIAELLGLTPMLKQSAVQLGAAEKQLISLGRGVVREDMAAVLLDEPLTVIDPHQKWHIRRKLKQLQQQLDLTMIYVTHDQHEALTFADQVTVMNVGHALQTGSPQELHDQPQAPFVGYFIGSPGMNLFDAILAGNYLRIGELNIPLPDDAPSNLATRDLKIGIRPEFVSVNRTASADTFACVVDSVHLTGPAHILALSGSGLQFKARVAEQDTYQAGDTVHVMFPQKWTIIYVDEVALQPMTQEQTS